MRRTIFAVALAVAAVIFGAAACQSSRTTAPASIPTRAPADVMPIPYICRAAHYGITRWEQRQIVSGFFMANPEDAQVIATMLIIVNSPQCAPLFNPDPNAGFPPQFQTSSPTPTH